MKLFSIIILSIVLVACGKQAPTPQSQSSESIFVLFENGGTVAQSEQGEALNTALNLLQQITSLDRRKATRNTQVHIILSALPGQAPPASYWNRQKTLRICWCSNHPFLIW